MAGKLETCIAQLLHADPEEREAAAEALGAMARRAKKAGPALVAASVDPNARVRCSATWAVGEVGHAAGVDAVELRLSDKNARVREYAPYALRMLGAWRSVPAIVPLASDKNAKVRAGAVEALGSLATDAAAELQRHGHIRAARKGTASDTIKGIACRAVLDATTDKSAAVRKVTWTALQSMKPALLLPVLSDAHIEAMLSEVRTIRSVSARINLGRLLGSLGRPEVLEVLLPMPGQADKAFRAAAVELGPAAWPALADLAERSPEHLERVVETAFRLVSNYFCIDEESCPLHDTPEAADGITRISRVAMGGPQQHALLGALKSMADRRMPMVHTPEIRERLEAMSPHHYADYILELMNTKPPV